MRDHIDDMTLFLLFKPPVRLNQQLWTYILYCAENYVCCFSLSNQTRFCGQCGLFAGCCYVTKLSSFRCHMHSHPTSPDCTVPDLHESIPRGQRVPMATVPSFRWPAVGPPGACGATGLDCAACPHLFNANRKGKWHSEWGSPVQMNKLLWLETLCNTLIVFCYRG